jgi:MSHA biogenesis protein MshO
MFVYDKKRCSCSRAMHGFTLIELLLVIIILGIGAAMTTGFITNPFKAFTDMSRRAALTDQADTALYRMTREIRQSLPNSVRVTSSGSRVAIEFLQTRTAGRYRFRGAGDKLNLNQHADTFEVLGGLNGAASIATGAAGKSTCLNGVADCLVIYNTGTSATANNAYQGDNVATITSASANSLGFDNGAASGKAFPLASPAQRFYVVERSVSFVCDLASGSLLRFAGYGLHAVQPINDADFGVGGYLLTDSVNSCSFTYTPGTNSRNGVAVLNLGLARAGEQIALLEQVHIFNSP